MDTQDINPPRLFSPYHLRSVELPNRIVVSPMSMYSAQEGYADDFHLVHLGRFALGGAGLVMMEATAVQRWGRGTDGCLGIWLDGHVPALRRITTFLHEHGSKAGLQLGHAGPKGSTQRPWHGGGPLTVDDAMQRKEFAWDTVSASAKAVTAGWPAPSSLTPADLDTLVDDWCAAARRAAQAGFDVLELHFAHGYLLHAFLSPLTNDRSDEYGGSLENRMRLPLRIAQAVRKAFPAELPIMVRISAIDGVDIGWSIEDSVALAKSLASLGIDAITCSSGGVVLPKGHVLASRAPGFQVPFAEQVRRAAGIPTVAVGMIRTARQAEDILQQEQSDLVALAREMLFNPNWAAQAALELEDAKGWRWWPEPFRWWLERRARQLAPRVSA
ncbi:MAG: NADH:flavin oxidoreductase/NADH oxidase [Pusillimonas sp.]